MKRTLLNTCLVWVLTLIFNYTASAQGTYLACQVSSTTDQTGTYFDTGGLSGSYLDNENCTLLINPSCATSITLTFTSFVTESGYDFLSVYDGPTTAAPQVLAPISGTQTLAPVICTSGYMLIVWHSDFTVTAPGWEAHWTSVIAPSNPPTTQFMIGDSTPPLAVNVQFTDQSLGNPTRWVWDFGDGDTSHMQNPLHAYANPGPYTVFLTAFTCNDSDTTSQSVIVVQPAPEIFVTPDSLTASAFCGDSVTFNLDISNIAVGGGQLVYSTNGTFNQTVRVLMMSYGSDQFSEYQHTKNAIGYHFSNYLLTETTTIDPGTLHALLIGKNVLLIPEQEYGDPSVWYTLGPVIQQYLTNGGSVVFCGSFSSQADCMFATGVFSGSFNNTTTGTITTVNPTHPLAVNLTPTFTSPSATYSCTFNNIDKVNVCTATNNQDVITYRPYNSGKAIYVGFDYYVTSVTNMNGWAMANAIEWGGQNNLASWVTLDRTSDTVDAGNTSTVLVTFQTTGMPAGTYTTMLAIASNDPNNPIVLVPCSLTITGDPIIGLSDTCIDFGPAIMQHTTAIRTFQILNNGCDTLFITGVTSDSAQFTVTQSPSFLLPGAFANVTVSFMSHTFPGPFNSHIRIFDNDVDTVLCLTASTFAAPRDSVSPSSITNGLPACGATTTSTFTINNPGGTDLIFTLGPPPSWFTASPTSGTVPPGGQVTITITFNSGTLTGGLKTTNLQVNSNDPLAPTKNVPVNLAIQFNPCGSYTYTTNTCTGEADFTSAVINGATSYRWDFGEPGFTTDTSSAANPIYHFHANGNYNVMLIVSNGNAPDDTIIQNVQAIITGPQATNCYPVTTAYCCQIGIVNVSMAGVWSNINKNTNDAIDGFSDYTCTDTASLFIGGFYTLNVTTGVTYPENVKAWIDFNDDGILTDAPLPGGERIMDHIGTVNHSQFFSVPAAALMYPFTPRRMRIVSDWTGNPVPTPCLDLTYGQAEDYTIFIHDPNDPTAIKESALSVPFSVYPNPFSKTTQIEYNLAGSSKVSVEVFNVLGERVKSFVFDQLQAAGKHTYQFEAAPKGFYYVTLTVDGQSITQKIVKM